MSKFCLVYFVCFPFCLMAQPAFNAGVPHTNTTLNWSPSASGSRIAVDYSARKIYIHDGTTWLEYEQGIDRITGSVAPAYTPAAGQSLWAVNAANELYYYNSTWVCVSCQQPIVTDATLTGDGTDGNPLVIAQQGATTGQVLKWDGSAWGPSNDLSGTGTIGGSIASTQIAYGSGANNITGNANFVYDAGAAGMSIKGGTPSLTLNATTSTSAFGHLFSYNNAPRFRFIYQENVAEFRLQGTDAVGDFTVKPAILAKRGASGNKVGFNLAAGSTPAGQIHVNGSGATSGTYTAVFHNSTGANNALVIRDDGNVGFGNASPTRTLDINGELRIRDLATTTPTQILVVDNDGVVSSVTLGSGLSLSSGVLANNVYFDALETATSGTSYQITGLKSKVLVTGSLIATVNLPDIVTTVPTSNQVNPGFTVIIEISRLDSTTLSVASGSSDILFSSGSSYTGTSSLNLTGNITNVLLCVAMQDGRWTILK